mmetsp:Transcript_4388/g.11006  ORF Transcript_4388/g.11006 Transcript_4388/m.11006 type:complete len:105 (-) Transcript_4388:13-327(-)
MLTIRTAVDAVVEPGAAAFIFLGLVGGLFLFAFPGLTRRRTREHAAASSLAYLSELSRRDARAVAAFFVQCGGYVATYYRPLRSVYWWSLRVCSIIHGSRGTRP